jgi:16S rRNA (cytidine1402-2'-O)-methyltransferase
MVRADFPSKPFDSEKGVLYVVSTPIGNLEDITLRALRILKEVDLVAAEDTRRTGLLLKHYQIDNQLSSYHDFNKEKRALELIGLLKSGKSLALISDAGTPGISDPGYLLIKLAIQDGIEVVPIPGVSAILAGLVVSGLPTDRFSFEGFLPSKSTKRKKKLESLITEPRTMIFYESPHRLNQTLAEVFNVFGDREIVVARELTKKFEEIKRGRVSFVKGYFQNKKVKGEIVIILAGAVKTNKLLNF